MNAESLVHRIVDSMNRRDWNKLATCYAPHAQVRSVDWPEAANFETYLGAFMSFVEMFPDIEIRPHNIVADDRRAYLEARLSGTNTGPVHLSDTDRMVLATQAQQLPPTGRPVDFVGIVVMELDQGQVSFERHYWSWLDTLLQLELLASDQPVRAENAS